MHIAQVVGISSNISLRKSTYETLKRLHYENPSNIIFSFINSIRY